MEIFLKILSMDESGLELRKNKTITIKELLVNSTDEEKEYFFVCENNQYLPRYKNKITKKDKKVKLFNLHFFLNFFTLPF